MGAKVNMIGERFGRLVVLEELDKREKNGAIYYRCVCDCGNIRDVCGTSLRAKRTTSCGCFNREIISKDRGGVAKELLFGVWRAMNRRCNDCKDKAYKNYGARGITVCKEWGNSYQTFKQWSLENGYRKGLWIDRLDNDSGYSPQNCAWRTPKENQNNKRTNKSYKQKHVLQMIIAT